MNKEVTELVSDAGKKVAKSDELLTSTRRQLERVEILDKVCMDNKVLVMANEKLVNNVKDQMDSFWKSEVLKDS